MSCTRAVLLFNLMTVASVIKAQSPEPGQRKVPTVESTAELGSVLPEFPD